MVSLPQLRTVLRELKLGLSARGTKSPQLTNLRTDLEASRERLATCCQPYGNREGPTFLAASIGRRESRPSCWLGWGVFSPICRIRQGPSVSPRLSSCAPPQARS